MSRLFVTPIMLLWFLFLAVVAYIGGQELGRVIFGSPGGLS